MADFTNIVIYHPTGISDTIMATPVAAAIKADNPAARVTWICLGTEIKNLLIAVCPSIDDAVEISVDDTQDDVNRLIHSLSPDLLINLTNDGVDQSLVQKIFSFFGANKAPPHSEARMPARLQPGKHLVDQYLRLPASFGIDPRPDKFPTIFPEALRDTQIKPLFEELGLSPTEPVVGLVPGVGAEMTMKSWLPEGWAYLVQSIASNTGTKCILLGGADDAQICNDVEAQCEGGCINLAGKLGLTQAAGLLKALALVIGGDCGAIHLSVAASTPVIGLYGPTKSSERGAYGQESLVIDNNSHCECAGMRLCMGKARGAGNCMRHIELSEVLEKVYTVLDEQSPPLPVRDSSNWFWSGRNQLTRPVHEN